MEEQVTKKTYIVHVSEYPFRDDPPRMYEFVGAWRTLLERLNDVTDENRDEVPTEDDAPDGSRSFPSEYTDDELVKLVEDADEDDGGHFHDVWCVEDRKQVMGYGINLKDAND